MISEKALKSKILENPIIKRVLSYGEEIYIVGGYLRDLLYSGGQGRDIDFAIKRNIRRITTSLARELDASLVELRKEQITRLVLKNGITLDFSVFKKTISDDLESRDFTVNAMAWSPMTGLIDPLNGLLDIKNMLIRAISIENFKSDPLRMLRAYRLSAELSWKINMETRALIRDLNKEIKRSACERITLEFIKLICSDHPEITLKYALDDGVLNKIISLSFKDLAQNVKHVSIIDKNLKKIPEKLLSKNFPQGLSYRGILRLETLLFGSVKDLLCLSREARDRIAIVKRLYNKYLNINRLSRSETFDLFSKSRGTALDLLILTGRVGHIKDLMKYRRILGNTFLSGQEIMEITGFDTGPGIGKILDEINRRRFEDRIRNRKSALVFVKKASLI